MAKLAFPEYTSNNGQIGKNNNKNTESENSHYVHIHALIGFLKFMI